MIVVNGQEAKTLVPFFRDLKVEVDSDIGTDIIIQGVEKNRMYERKELKDFIASIMDGRIFEQLKDLSNNAEKYEPFVIIEGFGFYDYKERKFLSITQYLKLNRDREVAFYEVLTAFRAFGVGLVWTIDTEGTVSFLARENTKLGEPKEKKEYPERRGFRRDWTVYQKRLYFMEAFGHETAKALIGKEGKPPTMFFKALCDCEECNSLDSKEEAIEWIADHKLYSGRRIGESKAKEIYEVIHG